MIKAKAICFVLVAALCSTTLSAQTATKAVRPSSPPAPAQAIHEYKEMEVEYMADNVKCKGYVVYDAHAEGKRPAVLVVPEWWGCDEYTRRRAHMLAELGYIAMAVDMYGGGRIATDPAEAQKLTTPFYADPTLGFTRLKAAEQKLKSIPATDAGKVAAIGYCFGGNVVLNAARLGADYKAVVSFHGGLGGVMAEKGVVKSRILVCHGEADQFVSAAEVKKFRDNLDSVGVGYTFKTYPGATHAFTNPAATTNGKKFNLPISYNAEADQASWLEMKQFLKNTFYRK